MEITENIVLNGGAHIGWANATWPFAKLNVTSNRLELNTYLLGNFIFQPMDIISIVPYSGASPFKNGIKIIHSVENYNQKIVFWMTLKIIRSFIIKRSLNYKKAEAFLLTNHLR